MENKSGIYPKGDMVLVAPLEVEQVSPGGIVISQGQTDREQMAVGEGIVVAFGSAAVKEPRMHEVNIGDLVGFAKYAGQPKTGLDEVKYRLIRAADVICALDKPSLDMPAARSPLDPEHEFSMDGV